MAIFSDTKLLDVFPEQAFLVQSLLDCIKQGSSEEVIRGCMQCLSGQGLSRALLESTHETILITLTQTRVRMESFDASFFM